MINQENTYLGADGLAYCKICGEPVEAFSLQTVFLV